jgi:hypothetical protein
LTSVGRTKRAARASGVAISRREKRGSMRRD